MARRSRVRTRIAAALGLVLVAFLYAACQQAPLPEEGSADAQLYAQRCGACHAAYNPEVMTPAMWQVKVKLMEEKIRNSGLPPLTEEQSKTILAYLSRHAEAH
jgi:mono/diheme cytochrome c family protein